MAEPARIIEGVKPDQIPYDELFAGKEPVVIKGIAADWSLVRAGQQSPEKVMEALVP